MPQQFADQLRSIQMSPSLGESLERAHVFAREQSHRAVLLEHLLLALAEDPDAAAVMQASNVDPLRLGTDVSGYLGGLLEDMRAAAGIEPRADGELLRVLQAAGQAAQQSRRRQIDGAIVLAAIVGDGKSPAAGLLKAHGLTFEEAIRALQKANVTANAKARSQLYAPPAKPAAAPVQAAPVPAAAGAEPEAQPAPVATAEEAAPASEEQTPQSVDEILAAARARIQQRTAAMVAKPEAKAPAAPAQPEPLPLSTLTSAPPSEPVEATGEQEAPEAQQRESTPSPSPTGAPPEARSSWTPPPTPAAAQPAARLPPAPPSRGPARFPQRPLPPGEGTPRPGLPQPPRSGAPPSPGFPNRPQQAPWPNQGDAAVRPGPPPANGALADAPHPAARPRPGQRTGGQSGHGPLVETIPRRMRLAVPSPAQVRISRDKIDGLILLLLSGRGMAHRPDAFITRALSVRLRAPDGGFAIEPGSPETQWVEAAPGLQHDEFVSWRWTVTPQRRGRGRLLLLVTARTVGRDGLASETSPPDRVIEIAVKGGRLRSLVRLGAMLLALLAGAAIGRFSEEFWRLGSAVFKRMVGG